jgi:hypothetical protein
VERRLRETPDDEAVAIALFERAVYLARRDEWPDALVHFERSYAVKPAHTTLYSLAVARLRLGRGVAARAGFRAFLATSANPEESELRSAAVSAVKAIEARAGYLEVDTDPEDAVVVIDGRASDSGEPMLVDPGMHSVMATAPGYAPQARSVLLEEGEKVKLELVLVLAPTQGVPMASESPPYAPIALASAGGGVLTAAAVLGTVTWIQASDSGKGGMSTDELGNRTVAAGILGGVGVAALAVGVTWLIVGAVTDVPEDERLRAAVRPWRGDQVAGFELVF